VPEDGHLRSAFYRWKQLYGGLLPTEVKKLPLLEEEILAVLASARECYK
jgi:hypothetical protein